MKKLLSIGLCCLLACVASAQQPATSTRPAPTYLHALANALDKACRDWVDLPPANAPSLESWMNHRPKDPAMERTLRAFTFTPQTVAQLGSVLATQRERPMDTFVANRIIQPLLMAKQEVIREALPVIDKAIPRMGGYSVLPQYPASMQAEYRKLAARVNPNNLSELPPALLAKLQNERRIKLRNAELAGLDMTLWSLLIMANEAKADKDFIKRLAEAEEKGSHSYVDGIAAATDTFRLARMDRKRAAWFYDEFGKAARELRLEKKVYHDPGNVTLSLSEPPTIGGKVDYPGIHFYTAISRLAVRSRMPALIIPTRREIERYQAQKNRENRPPRR